MCIWFVLCQCEMTQALYVKLSIVIKEKQESSTYIKQVSEINNIGFTKSQYEVLVTTKPVGADLAFSFNVCFAVCLLFCL